jgi:hypothetical protein
MGTQGFPIPNFSILFANGLAGRLSDRPSIDVHLVFNLVGIPDTLR